ncbi:MAG: TrkH family potassium uptake protein [Firmicutes bacterium]|nr:TrkH family potassium uptake protein [Bacillota bacterium]
MNYKMITNIVGWVMKIEAGFMLLPAIVSLIYKEHNTWIFAICAVFFFSLGMFMTAKKPENTSFYAKEGFVSVGLGWIVLCTVGAVPFVASREIPHPVDAIFEIVSGFTTTGASILPNVEELSKSMLFWRSLSHWLGGMGVLVFFLALIPMAGGQNIHLIRAESTGPDVGKFVPKVRETAMLLYGIYFALSVLQFLFLIAGKMPVFDALCDVFGTAGTGGFGIKADSLAGYSTYIQMVTAVFMLIFGMNFGFFYLIISKNIKGAFAMEEIRWYLGIFAFSALIIALSLICRGADIFISIRDSVFQVSSIMTSTGYATADFDKWPEVARFLLCFIMFTGACTGSTGGGIKVSRFIIWFKQIGKQLSLLVHPRRVKILKMDGKKIEHDTIRIVNGYFAIYFIVFTLSLFLVLLLDNKDLVTTFSAISATFNNIGPGLGGVGPTQNFAHFSDASKLIMTFDMLAGRLEIFPLIILFAPRTWKKNG